MGGWGQGGSIGVDPVRTGLTGWPAANDASAWDQALALARRESGLPADGAVQLAQMEDIPEEEPLRAEPEMPDREMTDEDLRDAEVSANPSVRARAFWAAKGELAKLDPANPEAGPIVTNPGWTPSASDIARLRTEIADAKVAGSLDLTPEQYRDLARDPAKNGSVDDTGRQERNAVVAAWRGGQIAGPPTRSPNVQADFRDAQGRDWDVKSFHSRYNNGFSLPGSADLVDRDLNKGERVLVNTENMSPAHVAALKTEGARRGWGDRVMYINANPLAQLLQPRVPGFPE